MRNIFAVTAGVLVLVLGLLSLGRSASATEILSPAALAKFDVDAAKPIEARIGEPSAAIVDVFKEAGLGLPRSHALTEGERATLSGALAKLPPLLQRVMQYRLRAMSFIDGNMPNNALTSTLNVGAPEPVFDIAIRAGVLNETISELLTKKERTLFDAGESTLSVSIEGASLPALVYVLLHEGTHIVDLGLGLMPQAKSGRLTSPGPFTSGVWEKVNSFAPAYRGTLLDNIIWRGGKTLPIDQAQALYQGLGKTPFVSVYGSANCHEDLAEIVSWRHLTREFNQTNRIVTRDGETVVFSYEPMTSELVQNRLATVDRFFETD